MPRTYEPIASQTLGSDTATVSFTSIPQTGYTDLIIVAMSGSSGTDSSLQLRINTNSGNTLHSRTMLYYISSTTSARSSNDSVFRMANRIDDGTPTTTSIAQIMSYANTNVYKTALFANSCAGKEVARFVGLWRSTDAITALYLFADSGLNLKSGSTFSLYGIKAAWHDVNPWIANGVPLMPTTMKLISKQVLGSNTATVTFSSIPGTGYTDLYLVISGRTTSTGGNGDDVKTTFNSSATGYSNRRLYGSGVVTGSDSNFGGTTYMRLGAVCDNGSTSSTFGSFEMYVPNYAGSTNKSVSALGAQEDNDTTAYIIASAGLWSNTAAITSIELSPGSGNNWMTDSSFFLYAISRA